VRNVRKVTTAVYKAGPDDLFVVKSEQPTLVVLPPRPATARGCRELEVINANEAGDVTTQPATVTVAPGTSVRLICDGTSGWRAARGYSTGQGEPGPAGRAVAVFEGEEEPAQALAGDVWVAPATEAGAAVRVFEQAIEPAGAEKGDFWIVD
jgi:hypothetical protein